MIGKCTQVLRFEGRQFLPGDSLANDAPKSLLVAGVDPVAGQSSSMKEKYPAYVSRIGRVAGVVSVRIFEGTNESVQFLELYELESANVPKVARVGPGAN